MFDGLWIVEFISSKNRFGKGIIVLSKGRLFGGDSGYYYSGNYNISDNKLIGDVFVIRHDPNYPSVFGNIDSFKISIEGHIDNFDFSAIAIVDNMPEYKLNIVGKKKEDF